MIELSKERINQILQDETAGEEDLSTILRGIYARYMYLYEQYFADIDELSNEKIAGLKQYHEETISLIKYYYMDIPQDICMGLREFEEYYSDKLLGPDWRQILFDSYKEFSLKSKDRDKGEAYLKQEFSKQALTEFYDTIGYVLRDGFGTANQTAQDMVSGLAGLLFGKKDKEK